MKEQVVPQQEQGARLDTNFVYHAQSLEAARVAYGQSVHRLLDVNHWDKLCGPGSAKFEVTNEQGIPVNSMAREDFYFRIAIPAPGPIEGNGYDWVQVEKIDVRADAAHDEEQFSMRVRPASNPATENDNTAHFFGPAATSTFRVARIGLDVMASVHGRNETANTEAGNLADSVRNVVVSLGARAGFSSIQWNSLVKGIIEGAEAKQA
jgi:hypothetical protein